ncbi:hypothetical protein MSAN_00479300 [Mycena sanguinolenta]|uniref:Uncharacterized protein n=1 Tax=Mycena sanguinolenta TaxID=230812 RepID=A0A8H6Z8T7_9AGAR|nr:hypothetical protein MSAN_00479300 [Mycena sanguinolenta]
MTPSPRTQGRDILIPAHDLGRLAHRYEPSASTPNVSRNLPMAAKENSDSTTCATHPGPPILALRRCYRVLLRTRPAARLQRLEALPREPSSDGLVSTSAIFLPLSVPRNLLPLALYPYPPRLHRSRRHLPESLPVTPFRLASLPAHRNDSCIASSRTRMRPSALSPPSWAAVLALAVAGGPRRRRRNEREEDDAVAVNIGVAVEVAVVVADGAGRAEVGVGTEEKNHGRKEKIMLRVPL